MNNLKTALGNKRIEKIMQLAMLFLLTLAMPIQAVELNQEFKTRDGFTMHLPGNWVEIPNKDLKQFSEKISQLAPQIGMPVFDYGFQLTPVDNWGTYPYILIQVIRTRRVSERELTKNKINEVVFGNIGELEDKVVHLLSNPQLGGVLYDTENKILWGNLSLDVQQIGRVNVQIASILTEFGGINVMGYATKDTFSSYQILFQEIARQINLDNSIKYKPRLADKFPTVGGINTGRALKVTLQGAIICGIIGLIIWLVKRKKRSS